MDEGSFPIVYHDVETSWWWFRCGNLDFEKKSESSRVFCLAGIERVGGGLNTFLDPSYQTFLASSAADVAMRVRSLPLLPLPSTVLVYSAFPPSHILGVLLTSDHSVALLYGIEMITNIMVIPHWPLTRPLTVI